uniref:ATP-dependent DNA helicase n=1 Tax=Panagrolaimus sp. PS1159 TaxID=55785 RepID=A0AC35GUP1_9BILA
MLMRNLSITEGLCNGARLLVKKLECNIAEKLTNVKVGEDPTVMIPRITVLDNSSLYHVYQKQFSFCPAFALTVHKVQGQTLIKLELILVKEFMFMDIYIAILRTKAWNRNSLSQERDLNRNFQANDEGGDEDDNNDFEDNEANDLLLQQLLADANLVNEGEYCGSDDEDVLREHED